MINHLIDDKFYDDKPFLTAKKAINSSGKHDVTIEYIRKNNIYDYMMSRTVDYDKKEIGKRLSPYGITTTWDNAVKQACWDNAVREVCIDARFDAELWDNYWIGDDGTKHYVNIDLSNNKWWISNGMSYKYVIFNFIHILKCFDWDNDYLVAIGG